MTIKKKIVLSVVSAALISTGGILYGTMQSSSASGDSVALQKWKVNDDKSSAVYQIPDNASTEGLSVRLARGDSLDFVEIIDLSTVTKSDTLVDVYVTPDSIGSADFEKLYFTFTDVENPDCYLKIAVRASMYTSTAVNYPWSYFYAGGNGQKLYSTTMWDGRVFEEDNGGLSVVHSFSGYYGNSKESYVTQYLNKDYGVTNIAGAGIDLNAYGLASLEPNGESMLDAVSMSIRYDAFEKAVYANGEDRCFWDMDDLTLNEVIWNGFESGKVRLSVSADLYKNATANFVIKDVYGLDLTTSEFFDEKAPDVTVNLPDEGKLETYIGVPYKIPEISVYDEYDNNCKVTAKVWYRYDSATPLAVEIVDGKFTAEKGGYYTIVYSVKDLSGNETEKTVWVYAKDESDLKISFLEGYPTTGTAGEFVQVADYTVSGNVSGEAIVSIKALLNGEETDISGDGFEPQKSGTYTIEYTATDYLDRTVTASYRLDVQNATEMKLKGAYTFPKALVAGLEYTIPACYAYDYTSGSLVNREMSLYITDKNGERKAENNTFIPNVNANGDTVKLSFKVDGYTLALEQDVPVALAYVDEKLEMENYFLSKDVTAVAGGKGIAITAQAENASWLFANKLLAYDFNLELGANIEKSNFSALAITLTDSEDSNVSLTAKLRYVKGGNTTLIFGENERVLSYGFKDYGNENKNNIKLKINGSKVSVGDVSLTDKAFGGFPSGFVYLSVAFEGAEIGSEYTVNSVNGQATTNSSNDRIRPKIDLLGDYSICVDKDTQVVIPKAIAGDVLHGVKNLTVSVVDTEGAIVTSTDGIKLENVSAEREYEILVSAYGQYVITYTSCDTANELDSTRGFAITVEDDVVPEISVGNMSDEATVGDTILIPNVQYTDNVTATEDLILFITVFTPDGTILELKGNSNSFIPVQEGKYEIRICVYDETGNMGYWTKVIMVKGAGK